MWQSFSNIGASLVQGVAVLQQAASAVGAWESPGIGDESAWPHNPQKKLSLSVFLVFFFPGGYNMTEEAWPKIKREKPEENVKMIDFILFKMPSCSHTHFLE